MSKATHLPRRSFLKGLGASMALPMLDAMTPSRALAAATRPPVRSAFIFVPNGVHLDNWTPKTTGANFDLPSILEPLTPVKNDLLVLSGLTHDKGRANDDGPGDHARNAGVFLTGAQPLKSQGSEIRAGISVDQVAARQVGSETKFTSLELAAEGGRSSGKCDSGYSCAYSNNISWRDAATPMTAETDPRLVFERLFGNQLPKEMTESQARRQRYRKSILDFVLEDANRLNAKVGGDDKQKLDEYLTAVRDIEQRIERAENGVDSKKISSRLRPAGIPKGYDEHIRLLGDMMALAFQTDATRVASFMFARAGSNRTYRPIGVSEGHHSLSHHQNDAGKLAKISAINRFHTQQLAYILQKLKSIREGDGTLLDNCMIVYGSGISDGNKHNNENLPVLVAGKGGGSILTGRHMRCPSETPMANLFLSMLDRMGAQVDRFGDSAGRLRGLEG
ncbi:MAG: hypothetical protein ACI9VS_001381 [Candidatus Binatia bacterium]|jgi:hypothetical protein